MVVLPMLMAPENPALELALIAFWATGGWCAAMAVVIPVRMAIRNINICRMINLLDRIV
jgi:hypothetical protein